MEVTIDYPMAKPYTTTPNPERTPDSETTQITPWKNIMVLLRKT
jgi:hypothetical protein